jgi:hypothetical protein
VPFTISHAAAALPLRRLGKIRLPLAAVIIGSMSPDYSYFVPWGFESLETHSLFGLFVFCWPVSLALWILFVRVLEPPTTALLPEHWRTRFPPSDRDISRRGLALASAAVLLGAVTHVVWDSFTHGRTVVTEVFPALRDVAFQFGGWQFRWFFVLQLLSSVFGLAAIALWAWRQPPGRYPRPSPPVSVSNRLRLRATVAIIAGTAALATAGYFGYADAHVKIRLFHFLIGGMTGALLAWCAVAIVVRRSSSPG